MNNPCLELSYFTLGKNVWLSFVLIVSIGSGIVFWIDSTKLIEAKARVCQQTTAFAVTYADDQRECSVGIQRPRAARGFVLALPCYGCGGDALKRTSGLG